MNKSSRIIVSLAILGVGVVAGWYGPAYLGMGLGALQPKAQQAAPASGAPSAGAGGAAAPARPRGTAVEGAVVESVSFPRGLNAIGSLRSNESTVISAEIAGRIAKINFTEGQPVKKGDVLVNLDDSVAQAELAQARANLSLAQSRFGRSTSLQTAGFVSQQAKEDTSIALELQQAFYELAQAKLEKTRIVAPFDGVIGLRSVSVGEYLTPGKDIAPLEDIDTLKADFRLPERYVADVLVGQTLEIQVDAMPNKLFEGKVYAVSPLVEAGGRSVLVRAQVDNKARELRPGMFARVQLITNETAALVIPESALAPAGQSQYVFRVAEGQADRILVQIGERRAGLVEIIDGLDVGDVVVVAGLQAVRNKAPVNMLRKPRPSSEIAQEAAKAAESLRVSPS